MTKKELADLNARLLYRGAWIATYSPGDGVRRYRLLDADLWAKQHDATVAELKSGTIPEPDYFGGYAITTVLGAKQAEIMAHAYIEGWNRGRTEK